jgi:hypothetical protein
LRRQHKQSDPNVRYHLKRLGDWRKWPRFPASSQAYIILRPVAEIKHFPSKRERLFARTDPEERDTLNNAVAAFGLAQLRPIPGSPMVNDRFFHAKRT